MVIAEINNNFVQLSGDKAVLNVLYDELAYKHPRAYFMMKKIKYSWDGMVRPLSKKGKMATGLLQKAIDILSEIEEDYIVKDYRPPVKVLPIPHTLGPMEARPYQIKATENILHNFVLEQHHPRGVLAFAVSAGKTLIMFMLHASVEGKTLLVVDRKLLFEQLVGDATKVFGQFEVGWVKSKEIKWGNLMICMATSLRNRLGDHEGFDEYNTLLVDEPDGNLGDTMDELVKALPNCTVRVGFSGSIFIQEKEYKRDIVNNTKLRSIYGEPLMRITSKELEDQGFTTKAIIKLLKGSTKEYAGIDLKDEYDNLLDSKKRAKQIAKRIRYNFRRGKKQIFIFTKFIAQTEHLYEMLSELLPDISMDYSHHKKVGDVLDRFKGGELNVLITSLYMKRGINVPNIEVIINNSAGAGFAGAIQIFGRGVRKEKGKTEFIFEDFMDKNCRYLEKHSKQRRKLYKIMGLEVRDYSGNS